MPYNMNLRKLCSVQSFDWWDYCAARSENASQYSFSFTREQKQRKPRNCQQGMLQSKQTQQQGQTS